jgi:hypothetical protein
MLGLAENGVLFSSNAVSSNAQMQPPPVLPKPAGRTRVAELPKRTNDFATVLYSAEADWPALAPLSPCWRGPAASSTRLSSPKSAERVGGEGLQLTRLPICRRLLQRLPDQFFDGVTLLPKFVIPKSNDLKAVLLQPISPSAIVFLLLRLGMLAAIEFQDQPSIEANEIGDEGAKRNLAPKFETGKAAVSQLGPKQAFAVGHVFA